MLFAFHEAADLISTGAAPQAINVDIDLTFVVELVFFVALMLALKPLLFEPLLTLFEEREKRIDGAKLQARNIDERSASALAKYESEMAKARGSANAERDRVRAAGLATELQILGGVRTAATKTIDEGKRAARAEAERVRAALGSQTGDMARELAGRVLGREVQP
jgi:F-type H+-transporting ATPase subunit b